MLFWSNKALVASNEFREAPEVKEITLGRVNRTRVFYMASSTSVIAPPLHPGFFISLHSVNP
eukprot:8320242-Prorocentrum_lima.AAC.1